MKYRKLGKSDVEVSEISMGCWTMGGLNWVDGTPNGWANVDEDEIAKAVKAAVDAGVNHFDNADVYGNGRAERMLARVFKKLGLKSEDFIIATKVGHFKGTSPNAYAPNHIYRQCEQSLINLDRDYIDIYYLHHGNFGENNEYLHPAAETLDKLVKEGKIRIKGQSAYSAEDFERAIPVVKPTVLQSWANAMNKIFIEPGSKVANLLEENELSFVAFSPLNQGLLLDKFDPDNPPVFEGGDHRKGQERFGKEFLTKLRPKMLKLKERFGPDISDLAAIALRYVLNHPNVACVIPGFRNEKQVKCNLTGAERVLSSDDMKYIDEVLAD